MSFRRPRFRHHGKGKFPVVGAAVALLPMLRTVEDAGGIGGFIGGLVQSPATIVKEIVKNYTGVDTNTGQVDTSRLVSAGMPIVAYIVLKKFAGRRLNSIFRHVGVAF